MPNSAIESVIASAVALTTTATASTKTVKCKSALKHRIQFDWTPGTTGNVLTLTIESRTNGGQWTQEMSWGSSPGVRTKTAESYTHTAASTTLVPMYVTFEGLADELRVKYTESEAGGVTKGTITVTVLSYPY
jgi:hypothetical protein